MDNKEEQELKNGAQQAEETSTAQDLLENPEALAEQFNRTEEYVNKNKSILSIVLLVVLIGIVGGVFFMNMKADKEVEAQQAIFTAQYYFEQDSLSKALNGDGANKGFLTVAKKYDGTKAGNLANYYAGVIYLNQGEFEKAIKYLSAFSSSDLLVQPRAYALIGDANMELEKYTEAVSAYKKASETGVNKEFTPRYLLKLAIAQENAKDAKGAVATYDKIIKEYKDTKDAETAKKYKGLVSSLVQQ
ncbi:MAG: tetratricopeptide repeat protein [Cytophagales bacterium]|nr:tetratricopeptide repeat protein [Cytophagales bacterium]